MTRLSVHSFNERIRYFTLVVSKYHHRSCAYVHILGPWKFACAQRLEEHLPCRFMLTGV